MFCLLYINKLSQMENKQPRIYNNTNTFKTAEKIIIFLD